MPTSVTIVITSNDPSPVLIEGVVVQVYETGGSFVTQNTTDSSGEADFSLDDADYDLLFFKKGVTILPKQPQRITVDFGASSNTFDVLASIFSLPQSIDPDLCRVTGTLRGSESSAIKGFRLYLQTKIHFLVVSGDVLEPDHIVEPVSDENGFFDFELYRGVEYNGMFWNDTNQIDVIVPDQVAIGLEDLFFPVQVDATFSDTTLALVALATPPDETITYVVTYSDNSVRTTQTQFSSLTVTNDDEDVVEVQIFDDRFGITPLAAGVANITLTRKLSTDLLILDPAPTFTSDTLVVTVT